MASSRRVTFSEIAGDVRDIAESVVYATVVTVDVHGRPRARVMHPVWWIADVGVEGAVASRPTPMKTAHVRRSPHVTVAYWSPAHDALFLDCDAAWVEEPERRRSAWERIAATPPPMGYDPSSIWGGGPDADDFTVLDLRPFRVQVVREAAVARGEPTPLWERCRPRALTPAGKQQVV